MFFYIKNTTTQEGLLKENVKKLKKFQLIKKFILNYQFIIRNIGLQN